MVFEPISLSIISSFDRKSFVPNNVNDFITFLTFLFYGLVFFTAGVAITTKVSRSSKLTMIAVVAFTIVMLLIGGL